MPLFEQRENLSIGDVLIEIHDSDSKPLADAFISFGTRQGHTDSSGLLFLRRVPSEREAYLSVNKPGFFPGSRRFLMSSENANHVKITLIPRKQAGLFNSSTGGQVEVGERLNVSFGANSVVTNSGSEYSGRVYVMADALPADDPDLSTKMPGDLIGIGSDGEKLALSSFGMFVLELFGEDDEKLKLREGATARMQMSVPESMVEQAPESIPMWSFDEAKGYWKEETYAKLEGSVYVAELPHFSYWNCDAPFSIVEWSARFVNESGGVAGLKVCLKTVGAERCGFTDGGGRVGGLVPAGQVIDLTAYTICDDAVYSDEMGPFNSDEMTGPYVLDEYPNKSMHVDGTAVNCDGEALQNGVAVVTVGNNSTVSDITGGSYSLTISNCDEEDLIIRVYDADNQKMSFDYVLNYGPYVNAGQISACAEFHNLVEFNVEGVSDPVKLPIRHVIFGANQLVVSSFPVKGSIFYFSAEFEGGQVTNDNSIYQIILLLDNGMHLYPGSIALNVQEYGHEPNFVRATLVGTMRDSSGIAQEPLPFTGTITADW